ncbi:MAG: hypothetical protein KDA24_11590 [Deltaproteobacteria bacterium]|nr:hypothetical protein [Deltaproteobacteria bacterium]
MHRCLLALVPASALLLAGCPPTACTPSDDPSIQLGSGVGGAFAAYETGEQVGLDIAPQGGFGVTTLILTDGLNATEDELAVAQLDVLIDGVLEGEFTAENNRLLCRSDGEGGQISGVVVGFDSQKYSSNDDLLTLNGQEVDLDVTVTDSLGNSAQVLQRVTVVVGN